MKGAEEKRKRLLYGAVFEPEQRKKHVAEKKATVYPTEIEVPESITVKELAEKLGREVS